MSVLQATTYDLIEILYLIKVCFQEINSKGLVHWSLQYRMINTDLGRGNIYLYKKNGVTLGMVALEMDTNLEYNNNSLTDETSKPLIAHRLLVHPHWKNQGIENEILQFVEQFAHIKGCTSIRIDALENNTDAIAAYYKLHYLETGKIQFQYQKVPFSCFEKNL